MNKAASVQTVNTDQAAAWNGDEGRNWTEHADQYNRHTRRHRQRLLDANLFNPGDVALDIGCGTGKAARDVARIVTDGSVVGIDLSAQMLELAEHLAEAEGLANVTFVQGDVQVHPFDSASFDVALSSFGAMFFDDAHAAFANIGQALRPGGQLALLTWQDPRNNDWLMTLREVFAMGRTLPFPPPAAPTPFSLADPDRVHTLLAAAGYDGIKLTAFNEPIHFGDTVDDALAFARTMGIVRGLTDELSDDQVEACFRELRDVFVARTRPDGVRLDSAAWLVTAHR